MQLLRKKNGYPITTSMKSTMSDYVETVSNYFKFTYYFIEINKNVLNLEFFLIY